LFAGIVITIDLIFSNWILNLKIQLRPNKNSGSYRLTPQAHWNETIILSSWAQLLMLKRLILNIVEAGELSNNVKKFGP